MNEFDFIKQYLKPQQSDDPQVILGIGDDAAIVRPQAGLDLCLSSDILLAGRHFFSDVAPADLAHKVLAVNLSDMAAMGAVPKWALLSLALPELNPTWLQAFSGRLYQLAAEYGVSLIGGDTTRGDWVFNITIIGQTPSGKALRRDGAQRGDDIWVTGRLGLACAALFDHWHHVHLEADLFKQCEAARLRPQPRVKMGQAMLDIAHAAQDVSDGFAQDLQHILSASNCGAVVNVDALPTLASLKQYPHWQHWVCAGGDDYELILTAPRGQRAAVLAAAAACQTSATRVGVITAEPGLQLLDSDGQTVTLAQQGYDHFG